MTFHDVAGWILVLSVVLLFCPSWLSSLVRHCSPKWLGPSWQRASTRTIPPSTGSAAPPPTSPKSSAPHPDPLALLGLRPDPPALVPNTAQLRSFEVTSAGLSYGRPSKNMPYTNPLPMVFGNFPRIASGSTPGVALVHANPNRFVKGLEEQRLYMKLTFGSDAQLPGLTNPNVTRLWFKTYSENAGILAQLKSSGLVRHTGHSVRQAYVKAPCVDILVPKPEWANMCESCEKWEQVQGGKRMGCCGYCERAFYCNNGCQEKHWPFHRVECGLTDAERNRRRVEAFWRSLETRSGGSAIYVQF